MLWSVPGFTSISRATWGMGLLDFNAIWTTSSWNPGVYVLGRAACCFPFDPSCWIPVRELRGASVGAYGKIAQMTLEGERLLNVINGWILSGGVMSIP